MERAALLKQVQSYRFAAYDMLLYLDTHPDDKKAFALFKELVAKSKQLTDEFQERFGPLTALASANSARFDWIDSPWPWEKEANV